MNACLPDRNQEDLDTRINTLLFELHKLSSEPNLENGRIIHQQISCLDSEDKPRRFTI